MDRLCEDKQKALVTKLTQGDLQAIRRDTLVGHMQNGAPYIWDLLDSLMGKGNTRDVRRIQNDECNFREMV